MRCVVCGGLGDVDVVDFGRVNGDEKTYIRTSRLHAVYI